MAEPQRTTSDDGRWIVVDGRRWRATDPRLDPRFRAELVAELMEVRRAVASGRDEHEVAAARRRVHRAKVALGERGEPWWDSTPSGRRTRWAAVTTALADHRAPDGSLCPSDVARAVGGAGWRKELDEVREVARELARAGAVEIVQRGEVIDPDGTWRGPVRIRRVSRSARPTARATSPRGR
jgi:hypothetical protein